MAAWRKGAAPRIEAGQPRRRAAQPCEPDQYRVCKATPVSNLDQRGIKRITGTDPTCDIGAFEHQR